MYELLPPWPLLSAFLAASLLLAVTPGPGVLYIVARSLAQGRRAGLASAAGVALGNLANAAAASLGLAALFAVSSAAFFVVKYAGAAYLVYLGIRILRTPPVKAPDGGPPPVPARRLFRDGLWVALLNPKTTVFFAAFLPQFMHADGAPMPQGLLLGVLFVGIAATTDAIYALAAGSIARWLRGRSGSPRVGRYLAGGTFIGLGIFTALAGTRGSR